MITPEDFKLYEQLGLDTKDSIKYDMELEQSIILLRFIQGEL